jgi:predicted nucleic-acid-binding protein
MIALDTNVLVRYFVGDDAVQAAVARRIIEEALSSADPGFVSLVVLVELNWVLTRGYGCQPADVATIFAELIASPTILVEQADVVTVAIGLPHGEFGDNLIHAVGKSQGCRHTITFDRKFARLEGVELAT